MIISRNDPVYPAHQSPGGHNTCEKDCISWAACSESYACDCNGAGDRSHRAAGASCRSPRTSTASRLGLGRRLSPLEWTPLCLGPWLLGSPTASRRCLGCSSLGATQWRLGHDRRSLAVSRVAKQKSGTSAPLFSDHCSLISDYCSLDLDHV